MPSINLLDPSLGIQTIMESPAATRGGIPEARPLASNVLREAGLGGTVFPEQRAPPRGAGALPGWRATATSSARRCFPATSRDAWKP